MKTVQLRHVNGPAQAIISKWHRYTTKIDDVIDVNEIECETLLKKTFGDKPIFELVVQSKPEKTKQVEQSQDQSESVEV